MPSAALHGEVAHHVGLTALQREQLRLLVGVERERSRDRGSAFSPQ